MIDAISTYVGSCHCGAIGFTYRTARDVAAWPVRACQCSFCRAHQVVTTSDPNGRVEFAASNPDLLNRYRFSERTADFLVCRACGVYIGALLQTPRGKFAIININALRSRPRDLPTAVEMEYGSESLQQRIARREQHWTPAGEAGICM